jgi:hypothetical protein
MATPRRRLLLRTMEVEERMTLTPGRLFALLSREFAKARPAQCTACRVPFPYLVERSTDDAPNWYLGGVGECRHGCHVVLAQIVARLWGAHDLVDLTASPAEFPDARMRTGRDPLWNLITRAGETKKGQPGG